jgi:hypothetical protein
VHHLSSSMAVDSIQREGKWKTMKKHLFAGGVKREHI